MLARALAKSALTPLVALATTGSGNCKAFATSALHKLAGSEGEAQAVIASSEGAMGFFAGLLSGSATEQQQAVSSLHHLSSHTPAMSALVDRKAVAPLVEVQCSVKPAQCWDTSEGESGGESWLMLSFFEPHSKWKLSLDPHTGMS